MSAGNKTSYTKSLRKKRNLKYLLMAVAAIIIASFVPQAMFIESEVGMRILITCLGIDTVADGYEVTAQVFMPVSGSEKSQEKRTISVIASTVSEAIDKVSAFAGRLASVTHCKLILLGPNTLETDVVAPLDYFLRCSQVNWSAFIAATKKSAKTTLELITSMEKDVTFSWQKYLLNNKKNALIAATDFKEFMNGQYTETKVSYISLLDVVDPNALEGEPAKETAAGDSGESSAPEVESRLRAEFDNKSRTLIIRDGRKIGELEPEHTYALSWFDPLAERYVLSVSGVGGKYFGDGPVAVQCIKKRTSRKVDIIDGQPVVKFRLRATFSPTEVAHKFAGQTTREQINQYAADLGNKIEEEIKQSVTALFEYLKKLDADIFEFEQDLKRFHISKYREYKASHSGGDVFQDMRLETELDIRIDML